MTFNTQPALNRASKSFKLLGTIAASILIFSACKTAPVQEPVKIAPPPPPKPVKTYKTVNIGTNNYMTMPSNWTLKSGFMPKGYVRYTVKGKGVHMVITGFQSAKSKFSNSHNRKELDAKTLLYWSSASNRQKTYLPLTNHHRIGEYVQYHCKTGTKCYQVFPLSSWSSVIVSEFQAGDMKYNITAGVNGLNTVPAQDVIKGLISVGPQ